MFTYLVTTTDGHTTKITCEGDPTRHPTFFNRVLSVETIGQVSIKPDIVSSIEKRFERLGE